MATYSIADIQRVVVAVSAMQFDNVDQIERELNVLFRCQRSLRAMPADPERDAALVAVTGLLSRLVTAGVEEILVLNPGVGTPETRVPPAQIPAVPAAAVSAGGSKPPPPGVPGSPKQLPCAAAAAHIDVRIDPEAIRFDWNKDMIGYGSFWFVFRGSCNGNPVAVKVSKATETTEKQRTDLEHEVEIWRRITHPNVVALMGVSSWQGRLVMVTELMPQDLHRLIFDTTRNALTIELKLKIICDAARAVSWLHGRGIIHRDIKPANFLIDTKGTVKLADFGLSESYRTSEAAQNFKGTPSFCAPEIFEGQRIDYSIDTYAFGMTMYTLMYELDIFPGLGDFDDLKPVVCAGTRPVIPACVSQRTAERKRNLPDQPAPAGFVELVQSCWDGIPGNRPNFSDVLIRVEEMLITRLIPDEDAREFWVKQCCSVGALRSEVPRLDMRFAWKQELGERHVATIDEVLPVFCSDAKHSSISAEAFGHAVAWFGPFYSNSGVLQRMKMMLKSEWYRHDIRERAQADALLGAAAPGTFIVRPSLTDPTRAPFVLSWSQGVHKPVGHAHAYRGEEGGFFVKCSGKRVPFGTMIQFVEERIAHQLFGLTTTFGQGPLAGSTLE